MASASRALAVFQPYWWGDAGDPVDGPRDRCPKLSENHETDFLVIGGGYTGLSVARHLKRRFPDLKVTICESDFVGRGASGRNGGFLTSLIGHDCQHLIDHFGIDKARSLADLMRTAVDDVADLITQNKIDCHYSPHGNLYTAWNQPQMKRAERNQAAAQLLGYNTELWSTEKVQKMIGGGANPNLCGGFYEISRGGNFNPYMLSRGLLEKTVLPLGVTVFEDSPVQNLKCESNDRITCTVNGKTVVAKNVAICTNAYSGCEDLKLFKYSYLPIHAYQVVTEVLPKEVLAKLRWESDRKRCPPSFYTFHRILYGFRITHDGRLALGTGRPRYYWNNNMTVMKADDVYEHLEESLYNMFPVLKDTPFKIEYRWVGVLAATLDDFPRIGRDPSHPNVYYSFGYNGHGNALANYSGKIVADMFENYDQAMEMYKDIDFVGVPPQSTIPHPPEPIRFLAANGLIKLKKFLDRCDDTYFGSDAVTYSGLLAVGYFALRLASRRFRG
mmetsp:Transcript_23946/g.67071  ORF Transcript_23946/g.67071 Transcript_23946/m.67071 type:complete len:501 (+) Transcript_23946:286-1788(+)|eukprot:CAMPEP_0119126058 /NCGR_PEP_ID=MMETSP1310-20130426/5119_1 /TAXON_ID=464262 /ORGANISM="Genus nov. species nov., Strain RCC2339" /LENGTH=500 /DNA_ID=CAMNT_0007116187 /DNA_START=249 /DNA_END=1751 /DNA_ORIENTATION=-